MKHDHKIRQSIVERNVDHTANLELYPFVHMQPFIQGTTNRDKIFGQIDAVLA